jgi:hypothetical protein
MQVSYFPMRLHLPGSHSLQPLECECKELADLA